MHNAGRRLQSVMSGGRELLGFLDQIRENVLEWE